MRRGLLRVNNYLDELDRKKPSGPRYHGDKNDPRYPSPRELRTAMAVVPDIALHAGVAWLAFARSSGIVSLLLAVLAYVGASFVHTVLFQRVTGGATVGKLLFGVVLIRGGDGRRPTLWNLLVAFCGRGILLMIDGDSPTDYGGFLVHVRRRDVRALRAAERRNQALSPAPGYPTSPQGYPARSQGFSDLHGYPSGQHGHPPHLG